MKRLLSMLGLSSVTLVPSLALAAPAVADKADNAFMMICTALVLFMTLPGIALFYGGCCAAKRAVDADAGHRHLRAGLRAVGAVWLQPGVQRGQCGVRRVRNGDAERHRHRQRHRQHQPDDPRRLPGVLCLHYRGAGGGRLRRTHSLLGGADLRDSVVYAVLSADRAHGGAAATWPPTAHWTSPAAPWCTSTPPAPGWSVPT